MKVLVTGSSGMVSTHLCERLLKEGYEVVGVDWKPNKWNKEVDAITINVDLRDKPRVLSALPKDVDIVIHLAANAAVHDLVQIGVNSIFLTNLTKAKGKIKIWERKNRIDTYLLTPIYHLFFCC